MTAQPDPDSAGLRFACTTSAGSWPVMPHAVSPSITMWAVLQALVDFTETHVSTAEHGQAPQNHAPIPLPCLAACLSILASDGLSLAPGLAPQVCMQAALSAWSQKGCNC